MFKLSSCSPAVPLLCLLVIACNPFSEKRVYVEVDDGARFSEVRVSVEVNKAVTLAGTLSIPDGEGPFPAAILISGSGLQNRDCDVEGFKLFQRTAHHLTAHGIVVLRYDDRGFAESTGNPSPDANATLDFADDVLAQLAYLKRRPEVDGERIGLIGFSEGAIVASMVDARSDDVEFVVLGSAPALPTRQVLNDQLAGNLRRQGLDDDAIAARLDLWRRIWDAMLRCEVLVGFREELKAALRSDFERLPPEERRERIGEADRWSERRKELKAALRSGFDRLPPERPERIGDIDRHIERIVTREFSTAMSKWGRFLLTYDPRSDLTKMDSRVLALYGGKDTQVLPESNAAGLGEIFREAGKTNFEIRVLPDANHIFQKAVTGTVEEYAELKKEFIPGFLEGITTWILEEPSEPQL